MILHFENESTSIYNVVTRAHCELWVAWESFCVRDEEKKRKEREREREKGKKCNDVVTPLTICNANDVAADFSFLCNTSSIRNYHTKSPLVNKFFIVPAPVFPGRISFFLFIKFFLINRCIKLQRNNVVYGWKEERKKEKNNSE